MYPLGPLGQDDVLYTLRGFSNHKHPHCERVTEIEIVLWLSPFPTYKNGCAFLFIIAILVSIVVSIPACHAGDPGSIPGRGAFFFNYES